MRGSLRAPVTDFLSPGQSPEDIPEDEPFVFDVDESTGKEASQITSVLRNVLAGSILDEAQDDVEQRLLAAAAGCAPCQDIALAMLAIGENYRDAVDVFEDMCPSSAGTCSVGTALADGSLTKRGQTLTDAQYDAMIGNITAQLEGVDLQNASVQAFLPTALALLAEQVGLGACAFVCVCLCVSVRVRVFVFLFSCVFMCPCLSVFVCVCACQN